MAEICAVAKEHLNMTEEQFAALDIEAPIVSALALDSLGQVVLATSIEAKFGIELEPDEWAEAQTMRGVVDLILMRLKEG